MYMIVVGHCLFHGRVTAKLGYGTVNYFLSYLIQSFSVVHVNCFVMLAGYFSIDREFQAQRLFRFWRQVVFYSVLIGLICSVCIGVTGTDVIKAIFPVSSNHYWFASVYMGLSLLMPFAGMLAVQLTKKQYQYLLALLALFFSVNHMIFRVNTYGTYVGRELPWFLFLALLAGYLKLHTRPDRKYFRYGLLGYAAASLAVLASVYLSVRLHQEDIGYFLNYNSPLALAAAGSLCKKHAVAGEPPGWMDPEGGRCGFRRLSDSRQLPDSLSGMGCFSCQQGSPDTLGGHLCGAGSRGCVCNMHLSGTVTAADISKSRKMVCENGVVCKGAEVLCPAGSANCRGR